MRVLGRHLEHTPRTQHPSVNSQASSRNRRAGPAHGTPAPLSRCPAFPSVLLELDKLKVLTPELPLRGVRVMSQCLHLRSWDKRRISQGCWKDLVKVFTGMPGVQQSVQDSSPPWENYGQR